MTNVKVNKSNASVEQFEDNSNSPDSDQDEGKDQEWLKCMSKIINSTSSKRKRPVQSINNESKKEKKPYDFEIVGEEIKEEIPKVMTEKLVKDVKPKLSLRVKPSIQDMEREKALKKIATKGVVQLFNAVRMQQKAIQEELKQVGPLDHKRDEVLNNINKRKFLDVLMSGKRAKSELVDNPVKDEYFKEEEGEKKKAQWSVLRDDFMTNKKLKPWDKSDSESEEGSEED